ncbi:hypothetical protein HUF15_40570 [Streptomyces samsunensis]|uniref:hypothetical protein n=1 Tax=Streptomyces malaysiensis TaxID=92644 RepID=UPI0015824BC6|nr:hypothetical protein [Streptomyces samsunensis]NUH42915.1 hypothetical protein [Streptomyces samsunensis]
MTVGEAIVSHLPNPHAAAAKKGLDIRWLGLKYNVPAILIALFVTWRGDTLADTVAQSIADNGPFALLGWILIPAAALGIFMLTPVGGALAESLIGVIRHVVYAIGRLIRRGWRIKYVGYWLRLLVAIAAWSVLIALVRLAGRAVIHFLTGA